MKKSLSSKKYYIYIAILSLVINMASITVHADSNQKIIKNCLITAKTIKKAKQVTNTLFVDIRSSQMFNKKHIANSINIPLQLIATKAFLKNTNVVLVGNGWNETALIQKCIQLKTKGFKSVKVLAGGVISWFRIKGRKFEFIKNKLSLPHFISISTRNLISLTYKEFFNNKIKKNFVPFVVSDKPKKLILKHLPHAIVFSLKATKLQILNRLKQLGKGNSPIVIFSEHNSVVDTALKDYLRAPLRSIYYFEGGFNTYQKAVNLNKMTTLSNNNKRSSTKKPVSCAN